MSLNPNDVVIVDPQMLKDMAAKGESFFA